MAATRGRKAASNGQRRGRSQGVRPGQVLAMKSRRSTGAAVATEPQRLRVAIIDPHPLAREKVAETVEAVGGEVVWTAGDAHEALASAENAFPDYVVFEFGLPDSSGAGVLARMRTHRPSLQGVALSAYDDRAYRALTYLAGALGYLSKSRSSTDVRAALEEVWSGRVLWTAQEVSMAQTWWSRYGEQWRRLSPRQRAVATGVANRATYKEIAARLGLRESTVKGYVQETLAKVRFSTRDELSAWMETGRLTDPRVQPLLDLQPNADCLTPDRQRTHASAYAPLP